MFEFTSVGQMSLSKKIPRTIKIVSLKKIQFIFYTNWFEHNQEIWVESTDLEMNLLIKFE
jgi:hypothetical protein